MYIPPGLGFSWRHIIPQPIQRVASAAVRLEKSVVSEATHAVEHAAGVGFRKFDQLTGGNGMVLIGGVLTAVTAGTYAGIAAAAKGAWQNRQARKIRDAQAQGAGIDEATSAALNQADAEAAALKAERERIAAGGAPNPDFKLPSGKTLEDSIVYTQPGKGLSAIPDYQMSGLAAWSDIFGAGMDIFKSTQASKQAAAGAQATAAEAQARIAEAQANVRAQELALKAEAIRAKSAKPFYTQPVFLLGVAGLLSAGLFVMVNRRKGRR